MTAQTIKDRYRVGQTLLRIGWHAQQPFVLKGKITRVTNTAVYVDGEKFMPGSWRTNIRQAIHSEYITLFQDWAPGRLQHLIKIEWKTNDTLRCVFNLRRLERRLVRGSRKDVKDADD